MRSVNRVILIGRLGTDPEVINFDTGVKRVNFPLATGESFTNKEGKRVENTEWHNIVLWRKLADIGEKYLKKGDPVYIEGRIKTRSYDDKEGIKRFITEIEVENFSMLGTRNDNNSSSENSQQTSTNPNPKAPKPKDDIDFNKDLPF